MEIKLEEFLATHQTQGTFSAEQATTAKSVIDSLSVFPQLHNPLPVKLFTMLGDSSR